MAARRPEAGMERVGKGHTACLPTQCPKSHVPAVAAPSALPARASERLSELLSVPSEQYGNISTSTLPS